MSVRRTLCALLSVVIGPSAVAGAALAETDLGPITLDDLNREAFQGHGVPDAEPGSEPWNARIHRLLEDCALQQILLHEAEARGALEDPRLQAELSLSAEDYLAHVAQTRMIPPVGLPALEAVEARAASLEGTAESPMRVAWRFMLFAAPAGASPERVAEAQRRAHRATEALAAGASFEAVARELADPPTVGVPGGLIGPVALSERLLPEVAQALRTLPVGEPSGVIATANGPMIFLVESREAAGAEERRRMLRDRARRELIEEAMTQRRRDFFEGLRAQHPVEIPPAPEPDQPDATPVLSVGDRTLTLGDLRRRAQLERDPDAALTALLATAERERLAEQLLLLQALEEAGLAAGPEVQEGLEYRRRHLIAQHMMSLLAEETGQSTRALRRQLLEAHGFRTLVEGGDLEWTQGDRLRLREP